MRFFWFILFAVGAFCETGAVVGAGYGHIAAIPITPIHVAPGQVVTIFLHGFAIPAGQRVSASGAPLPYKLAGISASLVQSGSPEIPVPLMNVFSVDTCFGNPGVVASCGTLAGVTVQISFELEVDFGRFTPPTLAYLTVKDDEGNSTAVRLSSEPDQIHVVTGQDTILSDASVASLSGIVTHADGTLVDAAHPAAVGEQVTLYAVGLEALYRL